MIQTAVFLSIILSFLSIELFGLFAGGLITGGYLALSLHHPLRLVTTYAAALVVYGLVKLLARYLMVFGTRRYMASILLGLLVHWAFLQLLPYLPPMTQDVRLIGFIIPGLLANDMYRQGVIKTTLTSLVSAGLIRLVLMVGRVI